MDTLSSSSRNPYAINYLRKGRQNSENSCKIVETQNKRIKFETNANDFNINYEFHNIYSENDDIQHTFNEFDSSYELSPENCSYASFNDDQNYRDENIALIDDSIEEYSIDFIDETEDIVPQTYESNPPTTYEYNEDPTLYSNVYNDNALVRVSSKSKRKQGIVGRPPLSSPQRLSIPDNVYSHESNDKCFKEINQRIHRKNSSKKYFHQSENHEDLSQRSFPKTRPRILLKPSIPNYRYNNNVGSFKCISMEPDAKQVAQFHVANRQFARNLVARAQRQGTVIDKNKIPLSVLQQDPVDQRYRTMYDDIGSGVAEIKESEQMVSYPYTTTLNITDSRKSSPNRLTVTDNQNFVPKPPSPKMTASDLLKLKWKAENR